ncbi:MAG: galactose mutarotase [Vicinamibacterales bacterium]|nr:galactose mutarotase [Vicinamibacterales bacterium]
MMRRHRTLTVAACVWLNLTGCTGQAPADRSPAPARPSKAAHVSRAPFGKIPDGTSVEIFTITSTAGMEVRTMPYGAIVVSVRVPDRSGRVADVSLGFDNFDDYIVKKPPYFGVVAGRYANRIAKGRFTLDGKTYRLATNDGPNHLHGGVMGFDKLLWHAEPFERDGTAGVVYTLTSHDGDEGYPGTVTATVTYTVSVSNALTVDYYGTTDRATPVNLTQHTYFNLAGEGAGDILGHMLTIDADRFTPVDNTLIPTGTLAPVEHTAFDFRSPTAIGARIEADDVQLHRGAGYDHNFVLNGTGLHHAARLADPVSGRTLDVSTTEPGLQFYTGNFLDSTITGKAGHVYARRGALCLETQHFPDSPNHPNFPSTIVRPGTPYTSRTVFAFGIADPISAR